jgi:hypothetical protein
MWRGSIAETYADGTVAVIIPGLFGDQAVRTPCLLTVPLPGAQVIVAAIEGRVDDLIVIGTAQDGEGLELVLKAYTDDRVATRALLAHRHAWADLDSVPAVFPPAAHTHAYSSLTGIPSTFAPSAHTHPWTDVTGKPTTFAPSAHTHPTTDLTGTLTPGQLPAATGSAAGSMSAADKALVDAAASTVVANSLAKRAADGGIQFFRVLSTDTSTPAANHLVRRDYVDKLGTYRAAGTAAVAVLAAGATTTLNITFPTSRFTVAPIVNFDTGDGHVTVGAKTVTTTGATITLCNYTAAASVASTGQWQAVQMTAAAAAG